MAANLLLLIPIALPSLMRVFSKPATSAVIFIRISADTLGDAELCELSEQLRLGGADAVVLRGSEAQLQLVLREQQRAAADYPGPCPVLYEPPYMPPGAAGMQHRASDAQAVILPSCACCWPEGDPSVPMCVVNATDADSLRTAACANPLVIASGPAVDFALASAHDLRAVVVPRIEGDGEGLSRRIRAIRMSGCRGVLVDFANGIPLTAATSFVQFLCSKQSSTFGRYGLRIGFSNFMTDQFWLNREFKNRVLRNQ